MANDTELSRAISEFELWGVKLSYSGTGGDHIELRWRAGPELPERRFVIAKTGSDWRGWLNNRAAIRRLFKLDGLSLETQIRRPRSTLQRALELPKAIETDADQIRLLRAEVAVLTELVLELATSSPSVMNVEESPTIVPAHQARHSRGVKTVEYLSHGWSSVDALARDMGLSVVQVKRKLEYLLKASNGVVEVSTDGRWRRKRVEVAVATNVTTLSPKRRQNQKG